MAHVSKFLQLTVYQCFNCPLKTKETSPHYSVNKGLLSKTHSWARWFEFMMTRITTSTRTKEAKTPGQRSSCACFLLLSVLFALLQLSHTRIRSSYELSAIEICSLLISWRWLQMQSSPFPDIQIKTKQVSMQEQKEKKKSLKIAVPCNGLL